MTSLLAILRESTPDRHQKAVRGLADGSLTVTITRQTEAEVRAIVKNGEAKEYRVIINDAGAICSCPDTFYHRGPCKHIAAVSIFCLQQNTSAEDLIHLMHDNGIILCGESHPKRFWQRWTWNALSWPDICTACVFRWTHASEEVHHA